jgi:hypothetical protein
MANASRILAKSGACEPTGCGKIEAGNPPSLWVPRLETGGFSSVTLALTVCELEE